METVTRVNGNGQSYTSDLPRLLIMNKFINDVALAHITANTGLVFVKTAWWYEAQPETALQIATLLMTYNYKTRYYDNWDFKNTLMLKSDHHVGFDVESICFDCCKHNNIHTTMPEDARLSC
jgi:hypothetical protein